MQTHLADRHIATATTGRSWISTRSRATIKHWLVAILFSFSPSVSFAKTIPVALQPGQEHAAFNSAALQNAIDHAAAGDTISLGKGTFSLFNSIALKTDINLAGAGVPDTTLTASFTHDQPMIVGAGLTKVDLHGFTLDGTGNTHVTQGIQLEKSSALAIHDLTIVNLAGTDQADAPLGPHAINCTGAVTKSSFDAITCRSIAVGKTWGCGIRLSWGSSGNHVTRCTVETTGRGGIFCNDGSTDNVITDNTVTGSGGVGLGIEVQNCDRSLIERNKIDHWLSVDNSSMSAVRGNTINATDNTYKLCGIEIVDSRDVIVSDNSVIGGAKVGLSISGPHAKERMLINNNLFAHCTTWGAQIQGDAGGVRNLYFEHNAFLDTRVGPEPLYPKQGHGLRINGDAQAITFDRNEMTHNAGLGMQITGANVDQLYFFKNLITENRGGVVESDPIKQLVWVANHTDPSTTFWLQNAKSTPPPQMVLDVDGGKVDIPGTNHWSATTGQTLHFTIKGTDPFVPHDILWDFGNGLPRSGPTAAETFDKVGVDAIDVIAWDAEGHAAHATASVEVKLPTKPSP